MINKVGKKTRDWWIARRKLVNELRKTGEYRIVGRFIVGICPDCNHYHQLTPDHLKKRSQGGTHDKSNVEFICNAPPCYCHDKRDNQGDPMKKKITRSSKKAIWEQSHECRYCKRTVSMFLCPFCHKKSI